MLDQRSRCGEAGKDRPYLLGLSPCLLARYYPVAGLGQPIDFPPLISPHPNPNTKIHIMVR
jgi:hypothetical protein